LLQLFWSLASVTHPSAAPLPQRASPAGQPHAPAWQVSVAKHGSPHPPQLLWSVAVLTHVSGVPHMMPVGPMDAQGTHLLFEHVWLVGQIVPQPPQLLLSVVVSTHAALAPAPHVCWPVGHAHADTPVGPD
jgi:hypothetical protein